jgi:hypothetical protein
MGDSAFPGSAQLFTAQKRGARGVRSAARNNAHQDGLMPSERAMEVFKDISSTADPLAKAKESLLRKYIYESCYDWLWKMQLNFNILLYGYGSKDGILNSFTRECLSGEDILSIDGTGSQHGLKIVKALLDTVCTQILGLPVETTTAFVSLHAYSLFIQGEGESYICADYVCMAYFLFSFFDASIFINSFLVVLQIVYNPITVMMIPLTPFHQCP